MKKVTKPAVSVKTRKAAAATSQIKTVEKRVEKKEEEQVVEKKKTRSIKPVESAIPVFSAPVKEKVQVVETVVAEHVSKRAKTQEWDDLDAEDENDPVMASEYVNEIFEYMKELEVIPLT